MYLKIHVQGIKNQYEKEWGETVGIKALNFTAMVCNRLIIPVYNKLYKVAHKNYENCFELPDYEKGYFAIANSMAKAYLLLNGGYNFKENRKICMNMDYTMYPTNDDYYITDDLLSVSDIKSRG